MSAGIWVVVAAVVVALVFGGYRWATDGRLRGTRAVAVDGDPAATAPPDGGLLAGTPWSQQAGERATLVQFSSAFCAPCRVTRRVLAEVAAATPGVAHVEIDAEQHLDVVRRLGILRTPTTLVLDAAGRERGRAVGAPRRDQVERSLAELA